MGEKATALHREHEVVGRVRVPAEIARRPLERVERAVDLDRAEPPAGELELTPLRQALRIEDAAPRGVAPAGDADPHAAARARTFPPPRPCDRRPRRGI